MKLRERESTVTQNFDPVESYDLEISKNNSAAIMERLIDIYKDTEAAIIREYSANARDAHIEAGKHDIPIEVTTPKYGNSHLKIRDYGVGLDSLGLKRYVSLGDTTKGKSNDQAGAYGLGCKSALAFTSQFTVIAVKDGKKRYASVGRNRDNKFSMEVFKTIDTDEVNGVEIKIPIPEDRRESVTKKAEEFFKYWEKGTVLLNGKEPENYRDSIKNPETDIIETASGSVYLNESIRGDSNVHVVMGNVAYPVEVHRVIEHMSEDGSGYQTYRRDLSAFGFNPYSRAVLNADIGSVDLVPSRDSLKYSSYTLDTLAKLLKGVRNEAVAKIDEEIGKATSYAEAEEKIYSTKNLIDDSELNYGMRANGWKEHPWAAFVGKTYGTTEYSTVIQGLTNPNFTEKAMDKKITSLKSEISKLNSYDREDNIEIVKLENKIREAKTRHTHTVKAAKPSFGGGLKYAKLYTLGNASTPNDLIPYNSYDISIEPEERIYHYGLNTKAKNPLKRTIVWWNSEDGVDNENIKDFKLSTYKQKLSIWMKDKDLRSVHVLVGEFDQNPWVFENDNITIVKGTDFDKEAVEIRKRIREENKDSSMVRTETQYDALVVHEDDDSDYSYVSQDNLPISDIEQDTIIYLESSYLPQRGMANLAHEEKAIIVAINRGRSLNKFLERAEKNGKNVIEFWEWTNGLRKELAESENIRKVLTVTKKSKSMGSTLSGIVSSCNAVQNNPTRLPYYWDKIEDLDELSERIKELEISGQKVQVWVDAYNDYQKSARQHVDTEHFSEREKMLFKEQATITEKSKLDTGYWFELPPSDEDIHKDYPMLKSVNHHASIENIVGYIELVNQTRSNKEK